MDYFIVTLEARIRIKCGLDGLRDSRLILSTINEDYLSLKLPLLEVLT
jgi:hypothetical protein